MVFVPLHDQVVLIPESGARTHEAHFAGEDIEQLRQFVNAGFPDKAPDLGDVRLGVAELMRRSVRIRVYVHGTELQNLEDLFVLADPVLLEEHGALAVDLDGDRDDQHREQEQNDREERAKDIKASFEECVKRFLFHSL